MGRPPLDAVRIYKSGDVRLPSTFVAERVGVSWEKRTLTFRRITAGQIGLKPRFNKRAKSPRLNLQRVFKAMSVKPRSVAGSYQPQFQDQDSIVITLRS